MLPLEELEKRIGYTFKNKKYLKRAVTHRSFSSEHNERLEFLGDSVLGCVIGYALFQKEDHFNEGSLSRVRANLVKMQTLAEIGEKIGVWEFLCVGEGEMHQGGNRRPSTMSDAVEAIFGALQRLSVKMRRQCFRRFCKASILVFLHTKSLMSKAQPTNRNLWLRL